MIERLIIKMNSNCPLVSVIMPNYNTPEEYLRSAIESVLQQTYQNIEFIIVDDASTEDDVAVIRSYKDKRIILLQNESNMHVAYTLNRALDIAKGEYIARMDSDDICLPQRIEKQVLFMQRKGNIDILGAQAECFGAKKGAFSGKVKSFEQVKSTVFFNCPLIHPSVMFKASFMNKFAIRYSEDLDYKAAEDYELWSRCVFQGNVFEYPGILLKYRLHENQVSQSTRGPQFMNANRVRRKMLALFNIEPDDREMELHFNFCTGRVSNDITLKETGEWAQILLEGNEKYTVFNKRYFKHAILQHFFVIAVKALVQKQITIVKLLGLPIMKKALSPVYYISYINRYIYSKRLNRM